MAALRILREIPEGIGDRAYNFHDYADEKREALEKWAIQVKKLVKTNRGGASDLSS